MRTSQIAVQLWSVNDQVKDSAALAATIRKLKAIGYAAVELFGFPIPEAEILAICKGEGMGICSSHENSGDIATATQKVIDRCGKLGMKFAGYPFPHQLPKDEAEAEAFAATLDRAGAKLRAAGIQLCYHNHAHEFRRYGGRTLLERIYFSGDPRNIHGELDVFWVAAGGQDPVRWIDRLYGRAPLIHLKDYRINEQFERETTRLGAGTLDFPAIVSAAENAGCQWYVVEQEQFTGDKFEELAASYRYLAGRIAER
jgi:sugar phosphate isomerase/epimerase